MKPPNKNTLGRASSQGVKTQIDCKTNSSKKQKKLHRIISALMEQPYNCFEAHKIGDSCLHTTVATIQSKGIRVDRKPERIEGRYGVIYCKRYWIPRSEFKRAKRLLDAA